MTIQRVTMIQYDGDPFISKSERHTHASVIKSYKACPNQKETDHKEGESLSGVKKKGGNGASK